VKLPCVLLELLDTHNARVVGLAHRGYPAVQLREMVGVLLVEPPRLGLFLLRHAYLSHVSDICRARSSSVLFLEAGLARGNFHVLLLLLAPLLLFNGDALHLHGQQLAGGPDGIVATALAPALALLDGGALEGGRAAVEDEDGQDAEPKQLANAAEEANDVRVAQRIALLVAHGL